MTTTITNATEERNKKKRSVMKPKATAKPKSYGNKSLDIKKNRKRERKKAYTTSHIQIMSGDVISFYIRVLTNYS